MTVGQCFCLLIAVPQVVPAELDQMENLTILYLHDNAVTDMGTSLKALKSLVLLDVSGNHLKTVRCLSDRKRAAAQTTAAR